VIADIPGLIEGAHEGAGLGDRFLGHVERTRVLLHLVDVTQEDPAGAYETIRAELAAYGAGLDEKPEIVALTKVDAVDRKVAEAAQRKLKKASGTKPLLLSAVAGSGVETALRALAEEVIAGQRAEEETAEAPEMP
jgi:GTP-binding protein